MPRSNSFHQPPWPRTLVFCITWVNPPYLTISKEWWSLYEISSCDISSEKTLSLLWNKDRLNYIIWLFGIHIHVDNHPLTREMSKYFIYAFQFNEFTPKKYGELWHIQLCFFINLKWYIFSKYQRYLHCTFFEIMCFMKLFLKPNNIVM